MQVEGRNFRQTCKQDEAEEGCPAPHGSAAYAHNRVMRPFLLRGNHHAGSFIWLGMPFIAPEGLLSVLRAGS